MLFVDKKRERRIARICIVLYFAEDASPTHNSESNYPNSLSSKAAA